MQVKATAYDGEKLVTAETVNVDIPTNIEGLVKKYGAEFCAARLVTSLVIDYQAVMRSKMYDKKTKKKGLTGKSLQDAVDKYKPSTKKRGKSWVEKTREKVKSMSPEEKRALIAELSGTGGTSTTRPTSGKPIRRAA